jgi:hypothetical protein
MGVFTQEVGLELPSLDEVFSTVTDTSGDGDQSATNTTSDA